jgi:hypothetical protein
MEDIDKFLTFLFEQLLAPVWATFDFVFAHLPLSALCILLGLGFCLPQIFGLKDPKRYASVARRFARSVIAGRILMVLAALWFIYYVRIESLSDFAKFKQYMMFGFLVIGIATCFFVRDFLAVRGVAVLFLLLAKQMVDTGRPHLGQSSLVLVIQVWAYILVLAGIWLTISPWRLRDFVEWATATERRIRLGCGIRLAFGLFIATLGLTQFRF